MNGSWIGERVTLPPYIEQRMRETAAVWQRCPVCRVRFFAQRSETCLRCDPTKEEVQPGVFVTRKG